MPTAASIAANGDFALTGTLVGTVTLGATTIRSTVGGGSAAVAALFSPTGAVRWARYWRYYLTRDYMMCARHSLANGYSLPL